MSVIGIDLGYQGSLIAAARQGGIETVNNEYSQRSTASCVSFTETKRELGEGARLKAVTNFKNTVSFFKTFLGRQYADADVQEGLKLAHYKHQAMADGTVGFTVKHLGEEKVFSVVQITSMLLGKLKINASEELSNEVKDVVIGCPVAYDDAQRRALLIAAKAAGLNALSIMNETAAVALAYGIYKQDLPAAEDKPRRVVFCDLGHSRFQLSVCDMVKGKLTVLATASEAVGGRDLDRLLYEHFVKEWDAKYKFDIKGTPRSSIRLEAEVEKLKKLMSANACEVAINIECFLNDKDVTGKMKRELFYEMAAPVFAKIEATCARLLADLDVVMEGKSKLEDIDFVEIVGGSARVPAVKEILTKAFGKTLSTTLNLDEAVARGCALKCAILSPTFRVRDFSVVDKTSYAIDLKWSVDGEESDSVVYQANGATGVTKMLSFFRSEDFDFTANYVTPEALPSKTSEIGKYSVKGVTPGFDGLAQKVKVRVKLNEHGIFMVDEVHMVEKLPPAPEEPAKEEEVKVADEAAAGIEPTEAEKKEAEAKKEEAKKAEPAPKKAKTTKQTTLSVVATQAGSLTAGEILSLIEVENDLVSADRAEAEKSNAKNAVEEYIYMIRDEMGGKLEEYETEENKTAFRADLEAGEDWLYGDGEDCTKSEYVKYLGGLKKKGDPIESRYNEAQARATVITAFQDTLLAARKFVAAYDGCDPKYAHLSDDDLAPVKTAFEKAEAFLASSQSTIAATPKTETPKVVASSLQAEMDTLTRVYTPVMNKPVPVAAPPPAEPEPAPAADAAAPAADAAAAEGAPAADAPAADAAPADPAPAASSMDVD